MVRRKAINLSSGLGRLRLWIMQNPGWHRPAHVADTLGMDRQRVALYYGRIAKEGDLEKRRVTEPDKGTPGPRVEYRLRPGANLLGVSEPSDTMNPANEGDSE
jgi:hypothetical protein